MQHLLTPARAVPTTRPERICSQAALQRQTHMRSGCLAERWARTCCFKAARATAATKLRCASPECPASVLGARALPPPPAAEPGSPSLLIEAACCSSPCAWHKQASALTSY